MPTPDPLDSFHAALEARHLSELTFAEVRRALQALSSALRREARADGRRGGVRRGRQARRLRPLLRADALPARARDRARARPVRRAPAASSTSAAARARRARPGRSSAGPGPASRASTATAGRSRRRAGPWHASASTAARPAADAATAPLPKPPAGILAAFTVNELADERAPAAARAARRGGEGGLDRPRRRADLPPRHPVVAGVGRGRSAPRAGARTSGASARPARRGSPSSARPPASTPAS